MCVHFKSTHILHIDLLYSYLLVMKKNLSMNIDTSYILLLLVIVEQLVASISKDLIILVYLHPFSTFTFYVVYCCRRPVVHSGHLE